MKEIKKTFARQLRKRQTPTEAKVWAVVKNRKCLGLKFRRQHVIEGFVVDFYCSEKRLAIEIDGGIHRQQKDYDDLRQTEIEAEGIKVIRIKNEELRSEKLLLDKIKEALSSA
ncbi:MAG: endonuclease domain-containing protein [Candidatus Margulisbacteria bacterium]|nr:endonuclease domain-containing protein [Candidatus Margulisiibacteriota bacterium]